MDYEFKDQLLASGRGGKHKAAVSDISVCTHHLRSLLKMPTHGEFDFESVGWWASLTSLLRWCWYRRLPELETVKLYLKGKMTFTRQKPLLWTVRQMQSYSFSTEKKTLSGSTSVFACEHPYTCMCEHATQKATVPHSTLFQEREAQGMTPAKRQAEMISLANSGFATQEESDDEYQWHRNDSGPRSPDTQYVSYNQPPHSLQLTIPKLGWMQSLVPSGPDKPS